MDHIGKKILPIYFAFIQAQDQEAQDAAREKLLQGVEKFAKALAPSEEGPYFFGSQFTIVDIALVPWVLRFSKALKKYRKFELPTEGGDENVWARFTAWQDASLSRESVKNTSSDEERYDELYKKYAGNTA